MTLAALGMTTEDWSRGCPESFSWHSHQGGATWSAVFFLPHCVAEATFGATLQRKRKGCEGCLFFLSYAEKQPTQVGNLTGNALEEKLSREEVGKILDNAGHHIPYFHWIKWCSMHIFAQDGFAREMGYKNYSHWATWRVHKLTWHLNQEGEGTLSQTAPTPQAGPALQGGKSWVRVETELASPCNPEHCR